VLKAPTQGGVWGREFLDNLTLAKFFLKNSAKRLVQTQDLQASSREPLPVHQVCPSLGEFSDLQYIK